MIFLVVFLSVVFHILNSEFRFYDYLTFEFIFIAKTVSFCGMRTIFNVWLQRSAVRENVNADKNTSLSTEIVIQT